MKIKQEENKPVFLLLLFSASSYLHHSGDRLCEKNVYKHGIFYHNQN